MPFLIMILIKAYNNSEWDNATHYFCNITNEQVLEWIHIQQKLENEFPKNKYGQISITYYPIINGDFVDVNEDNYPEYFKQEQLYNTDIQQFPFPEQKLSIPKVRINNSSVQIISYGKNSYEEFWTDEINLNQLLKFIK